MTNELNDGMLFGEDGTEGDIDEDGEYLFERLDRISEQVFALRRTVATCSLAIAAVVIGAAGWLTFDADRKHRATMKQLPDVTTALKAMEIDKNADGATFTFGVDAKGRCVTMEVEQRTGTLAFDIRESWSDCRDSWVRMLNSIYDISGKAVHIGALPR